jgi:hypothetical protein
MPEVTFFFNFSFQRGCGGVYSDGGGGGEVEPNWKNSSFRAVRRDTVYRLYYIEFKKKKNFDTT